MSDIAIKVENLTKQYLINHEKNRGNDTFREMIVKNTRQFIQMASPFKNKTTNESFSRTEKFLALDNVSFEIKKGDKIGIIGRNGAGKSTLLKVLSRITEPTSGRIHINGRIASLLEVGTGFHPELTGRENIYLNGAILGMSRVEIKSKFDEIVAFAEVDKFLDTPVKRYSSGMYVRLAFSVAAHLEPEILIIDEVLAVGDAAFQKKCLGKMNDVSKEGRTVLFVSHNMGAIRSLCNQCIHISNGEITDYGESERVISSYLNDEENKGITNNLWEFDDAPGNEFIKVKSAFIKYDDENLTVNSEFKIIVEFWNLKGSFPINISSVVYDLEGNIIFNLITENKPISKGLYRVEFAIPANFMNTGRYTVRNLFVTNSRPCFNLENAHSFEIMEGERCINDWHGNWAGAVRPTFIKNFYQKIGAEL